MCTYFLPGRLCNASGLVLHQQLLCCVVDRCIPRCQGLCLPGWPQEVPRCQVQSGNYDMLYAQPCIYPLIKQISVLLSQRHMYRPAGLLQIDYHLRIHFLWLCYPTCHAFIVPHAGNQLQDIPCAQATVVVQEVGEGNQAPPEWLGEIEPTFLSYEAVPLLNFPFFNEV